MKTLKTGCRGMGAKKIVALSAVMTDNEAIDQKMKLLESKIFGVFSPVRYELKSKIKAFIPFELLVFQYSINPQKLIGANGALSRHGEIAVIYDLNEEHAFHFDLSDEKLLKRRSKFVNKETILPDRSSADAVRERCLEVVRWKMLSRVFKAANEVELSRRLRFYREAWALTVECRGRKYIKYAYLDGFANNNEQLSGLKVRINFPAAGGGV
jgi:hypothetical protein